MNRSTVALLSALAFLAPVSLAQAGPYSDELGKCIVKSSTPADQIVLVDWLFASISAHPAVAPYAKITDDQRDQLDRQMAKLLERLLTADCRSQTVAALKNEGTSSLAEAFDQLGRAAMSTLTTDPKVQSNLTAATRYLDMDKMAALGQDAAK